MNILLTGATGLVGQAVTRHLAQQASGHQVYYAVRRPALVGIKKLMQGTPLPFVIVMIALYRYTKLTPKDQYTHTLQRLLHRPPRQLLSFIEEHSKAFQPKPF